MLTAFAAPSLVFTSPLLILLNTGLPLTSGNCKRSATNKIFWIQTIHQFQIYLLSACVSMLDFDAIDTSSTITKFLIVIFFLF